MQSVLGTILDPAADKALMTTLTITLAIRGLLPGVYLMRLFCNACLIYLSSFGCRDHWAGCTVESLSVLHSLYLAAPTGTSLSCLTIPIYVIPLITVENILALLGLFNSLSRSPTNRNQQGHF
jgi:phosphatidylglycerophosphate synthase